MQIVVKRFEAMSARELHAILRLRCDVFVVEQACAYADIDGRDTEPGTEHLWIVGADGETVSVYLRCLSERDGTTRIGRVVTAPEARGRGLASRLVCQVHEMTTGPIVLDAQSHLADWYRALGYEPDGPEFIEDGIAHTPMRRIRQHPSS